MISLKDNINVIVGEDDIETLKAISYIDNEFDCFLVIINDYNIQIASSNKRIKKTYFCNDEYVAMMILQTEFEQYKNVYFYLTTKKLKDLYNFNKKYFKQNYILKNYEDSKKLKLSFKDKLKATIKKFFSDFKINRIFYIFNKIYHIDYEQNIVLGLSNKVPKIKTNYEIVEINNSNSSKIFNDKVLINEIKNLLKSKNTHGVAIIDNDKLVGKAFIKGYLSKDRVFNIINTDSYAITLMNIEEEYRGKNLQQLLISELVKRYVNDKENSKLYAYIYKYNKPSLTNFLKCGFKVIKCKKVVRFLKHTVNKENI